MTREAIEEQARRILDPLRNRPVGLSNQRRSGANRSKALSTLVQLIESVPVERARRARTRGLQRTVLFGLAGSLSVAISLVLWIDRNDAPARPAVASKLRLVQGLLSERNTPLLAGVDYSIESLGRLSTPLDAGAEVVTDEGVQVAIDPGSTADLSFGERYRRIGLLHGKVTLSVPKLGQKTSLAVTTPDAVTTVHGTRFSVQFRSDRTCVRVDEGVVSVARGAAIERLVAGQRSGCERPLDASDHALSATEQAETTEPTDTRKHEPASLHARVASAASGTLTAENRLFERILAAEQARRWRDAERLGKRLLARYPGSPMAPETRRVLSRVLARGKAAAAER